MPEVVTKYPEVFMDILRKNQIDCGVGDVQKILTTCPPKQFCSMPGGEICIYHVKDISQTTQLNSFDFMHEKLLIPFIILFIMIFLAGILLGINIGRRRA